MMLPLYYEICHGTATMRARLRGLYGRANLGVDMRALGEPKTRMKSLSDHAASEYESVHN